ncbi:MAG TPA: TonB-dependent receptor [Gemmatimonadaceae bacterium]|nr:TonB-dependent receptor [Gemmatimonadaceae bacterium]
MTACSTSPGRASWLAAALAALAAPPLAAQGNPPPTPLPPVEVTVTRDANRSVLDLPFAISTTSPDSSRPGQRKTGIDETLFLLPGVTVAKRDNPAQDPRIAIRGFGARSAFGVRGVRVLRDGMPITLPDGQTPVDYLDLEMVSAVEVIRGSASALYGKAAGGVVDLRSGPFPTDPITGQARAFGGSYGLRRWVGRAGGTAGPVQYDGYLGRTTQDGYRDYAHQTITSASGRAAARVSGTQLTLQAIYFDEPEAQDPGALTKAQFDSAPRMADPFWVRRGVRKDVSQGQVGLTAERAVGAGEVSASVYGGWRDLFNARPSNPPGNITIDRASYGASFRATAPFRVTGIEHRLMLGVDAQAVNDDRSQRGNCIGITAPDRGCTAEILGAGLAEGVLMLDQTEKVSSVGPFVRDEIAIGDRLRLFLGARADYVKFEVDDHFINAQNPDDSGDRTLSAVSPMAGAVVRVGLLHAVYANVSTAFETPTMTELGTQPSGEAGLNRDLDPQRATTYETGVKGVLFNRLRYDVAGFATLVRDELIRFEVPGIAGRQYYRNAGRTKRLGAELGLAALAGPLELGLSYSYSDFTFEEYALTTNGVTTDFAGNRIPGIPLNQLQASVTGHLRRSYGHLFATVEGQLQGSAFANDTNTVRVPGFEVMNLRLGGTAVFGRPWLSPVVGIQNVFDRKYISYVNINANAGKYFEPAQGRVVYVGLTLAAGR